MNHKGYQLWVAESSQYQADYPNYCRRCDGWGGRWVSYDPSPRGISLAPGTMQDFDACPNCLDLGKCPRCMTDLCDEGGDIAQCPNCSLDTEEEFDGYPPQPEQF